MKRQPFWTRLGFALNGIRAAAGSEASFRLQLILALAAAAVLLVLRPPLLWAALFILSASAVLALELLNTALERLADRLHPERHPAIQVAKDCAAGAVLVASVAALIIGGLIVAIHFGWTTG
jgi:undecaprenol kinase